MIEHLIVIPIFMAMSFGLGWYVGNHESKDFIADVKAVWKELEELKARFDGKP